MKVFSLELRKENFVPYFMAIGALLAAFGLVVLVVIPKASGFSELKEERAVEAARYEKLQSKSQKLSDLLDSRVVLDKDLELFESALPQEEAVPVLMTQVEKMATDSGTLVKVLQFSKRGGGKSTGGKTSSSTAVGLKASLAGSYGQLLTFLKTLENASRVITVEDLRFTRAIDEKQAGGPALLATLGLSAYYLEAAPKVVAEEPFTFSLQDKSYLTVRDRVATLRIYKTKVDTSGIGKDDPFN